MGSNENNALEIYMNHADVFSTEARSRRIEFEELNLSETNPEKYA
jgi:hypothetical protein